MSFLNGMGPLGFGPRTGRGLGRCVFINRNGTINWLNSIARLILIVLAISSILKSFRGEKSK